MSESTTSAVTTRYPVQRGKQRATYDQETAYAILDEGLVCHVAFNHQGSARVLPTAYGRWGDSLVFHGHLANQMLQSMLNGQVVSIAVTLVDGMVLARSAFHHSMNYRSVVVYGIAEPVTGEDKVTALDALMEHLVPGRVAQLRPYLAKELAATAVVKVPIADAAAKVRTGPPVDAEADYALPIWAGVVPLTQRWETPQPCSRLIDSVEELCALPELS